ncbi:MAG: hypothetical protein AAGI01_15245 [Myxococcota bacterium]
MSFASLLFAAAVMGSLAAGAALKVMARGQALSFLDRRLEERGFASARNQPGILRLWRGKTLDVPTLAQLRERTEPNGRRTLHLSIQCDVHAHLPRAAALRVRSPRGEHGRMFTVDALLGAKLARRPEHVALLTREVRPRLLRLLTGEHTAQAEVAVEIHHGDLNIHAVLEAGASARTLDTVERAIHDLIVAVTRVDPEVLSNLHAQVRDGAERISWRIRALSAMLHLDEEDLRTRHAVDLARAGDAPGRLRAISELLLWGLSGASTPAPGTRDETHPHYVDHVHGLQDIGKSTMFSPYARALLSLYGVAPILDESNPLPMRRALLERWFDMQGSMGLLMAHLQATNSFERQWMIAELNRHGRAIPSSMLAELLAYASAQEVLVLLRATTRSWSDDVEQAVIRQLRRPSEEIALQAMECLLAVQTPGAIEAIYETQHRAGTPAKVRRRAANAITLLQERRRADATSGGLSLADHTDRGPGGLSLVRGHGALTLAPAKREGVASSESNHYEAEETL